MEIMVRRTESSDYGPLSEILDDEWLFRLYSKEYALKLAEYYLVESINSSNVAMTLLVDGVPKGLFVIRDMPGETIDLSKDLAKLEDAVRDGPRCKECLHDIENLHEVYLRSAARYKSPDWAELRLLIISKDCKGLGFGLKLINEARRIAESYGMRGFFFYTDTDCNYGFYDHVGAERVSTEVTVCTGMDLTVYGYRWLFPD